MRIKILPGALVIATLVTLAISLGVATPNVYGDGEDSPPTLPEKHELKYPNLGSNLDQLAASALKGKTSAKEVTKDAPVHRKASVAVTIYLSGNVDDVVKFLEDNGGSPRNVDKDYIEAYVPVSLLGRVSEQPGVIRVRKIIPPATTQLAPPQPPQPAQQVAGHGPPVHGSSAWNQAGLRGQGIKVGVIDLPFGFNGLSRLMGTELPSTVQARCYTSLGKFTRLLASCGNSILGDNHGTLVAEAVIDIAPEVSLYIATPRSLGDLQNATDWMVSQGVSVIVHSVTYEYDGPGDGTSPFRDSPLRAVDRAVASGAIWVNGAGNDGQKTWFGPYSNSDGDAWIDFNGSDEGIDIQLEAGDEIRVQLRWEDRWGGATSDFDLYVYDHPAKVMVASSFDPQQGRLGQIPFESLTYMASRDGWYFISVAHHSGSTPGWIQVNVGGVDSIKPHTESGSIANPAESRNAGMLAVGAAHWNRVGSIEPYSSRGPTPDGRVKPDIIGANCGATALRPLNENGDGFCGTSQAAPHVAGMTALVRQQFPTYTPVQVANYLKEHAEQRESPDPNNTWGHGFAKLPTVDRTAMLALYNATGGANWTNNTNWLSSRALSTWYGITTDSQGRITELNLTRNQLKGELPPELANLANLDVLALGGNQLTGTIPTWLSNLANLQELYLWDNKLTGEIPTELSNLTNLTILALSQNPLTGEMPADLSSLSNLTELYLHENQLTGEIPAELGNLTNLTILTLYENQLTGEIPTELGSLSNLTILTLYENQLTGEIPTELSNLTNLTILALSESQLTGEIPTELGSLSNLTILTLYENQLTGPIPRELSDLTNLTILALSQNQLTGEIPADLSSLSNLTELYLRENQLTGEIPPELSRLSKLERLSLSQNMLTGCVPEAWRDITESDVLELGLPFCTVSLNTAPVFSDSESNPITEAGRSMVENTAAGENVGIPVAATDNNGDTLTYALGGTDAASFDIDPLTGQLMTKEALDHETKGSYEVMITATDPEGASDLITVTITVTNEDEPGRVTLWAGTDALTMAPQVGETITGALMDPDGGVTGESWQWAKTMDDTDSRDINSWMPITGATDAAYMVTADDTDHYLRVMATYMDAAGTDAAGTDAAGTAGTDTAGMAMEYSMPTMMVAAMAGDTLLERYDKDKDGKSARMRSSRP